MELGFFSECLLHPLLQALIKYEINLGSRSRLPLRTLIKLVVHVVRGASFLTEGLLECDIARRLSVTVLCMLCKIKIRCNPMHPLYRAVSEL